MTTPAHHPVNPDGDAPALAVVVVNFNGWADVARLVESLSASPEVASGRAELVVVDNASDDPPPPGLLGPRSIATLILRVENGGFAAGVNAGWRATRARWVLLLNPDVVPQPGLIGAVLDRMASYESRPDGPPGIVGFGLRNLDGTRQPSVGRDPGLFQSLRGLFIPRGRRKYQVDRRLRPGPVPWVTGACALVDGALLREVNGLDEEFFLYYEEVALCREARRRGRRVEYDPGIEVVHLRPLQSRPLSPALRVITRHSKLLYFRKHLPRWQFVGLCWIVAAEARGRGAWARWRGLVEERRACEAVAGLARSMRRGPYPRGREVLRMAEGVRATRLARTQGYATRARPGLPGRESA